MGGIVGWLYRVLWRMLPDTLVARVLPASYRYSASEIPDPTPAPDAPSRLLVAPVNFAGQGHAWARSASRLASVEAVNMQYRARGQMTFAADSVVPLGVYVNSRRWQNAQFASVVGDEGAGAGVNRPGFTHVLIEAERPLFGQRFGSVINGSTVVREVAALREAGVTVAFVCHGTDIRLPSRHATTHADSPYAPGLLSETPELEKQARRNHEVLTRAQAPVFVSTIDLLLDVPEGVWLPVVVDTAAWANSRTVLRSKRPVVVHAPSHSIIKGSDLIDPVAQRLHDEGLIEYRRLQGLTRDEMVAAIQAADIVLEQFRLGSYGVAAVEAMAAGCVVVGHVDEQVRGFLRDQYQVELPIVESRAADLEATLRAIVADPTKYRGVASDAKKFATRFHDGDFAAAVLAPFLGVAQ